MARRAPPPSRACALPCPRSLSKASTPTCRCTARSCRTPASRKAAPISTIWSACCTIGRAPAFPTTTYRDSLDWLQIAIEASGDVEALEEVLLVLGASSVSLTSATDMELFEPAPGETPLWERNWVIGLFPASTDPATVIFSVQAKLQLPEPPRYRIESLADRDWIRACLADLKPMRFGRRLWICPSGHEVKEPDALIVHLDPGLAFGTGTHPSTALCLRALDSESLEGKSVIDYGCGSGVLA